MNFPLILQNYEKFLNNSILYENCFKDALDLRNQKDKGCYSNYPPPVTGHERIHIEEPAQTVDNQELTGKYDKYYDVKGCAETVL